MPKYVVATPSSGQVAGRYLGAAILPAFTRQANAYQSRGMVYGCPGTAPVPAPRPGVGIVGKIARLIQGGVHDSADAPEWFLPAIYFENDPGPTKEHAPVQFLGVDVSMNKAPVPALRPQNVLISDPFRAHVGGAQQIFQPQVVPVWLGRNGTTNG